MPTTAAAAATDMCSARGVVVIIVFSLPSFDNDDEAAT